MSGLPEYSSLGYTTNNSQLSAEEKTRLRDSLGSHPSDDVALSPSKLPSYDELHPSGSAARSSSNAVEVRSNTTLLSSGFPYPASQLSKHNIKEADWGRFTSEVMSAAKLSSRDWTVTIASGVGVGVVAVAAIHALGFIPAYYVARNVRSKKEKKNLAMALSQTEEGLGASLKTWNETFFAPRGLQVHIDLGDYEKSDKNKPESSAEQKTAKQEAKKAQRPSKKGRIVITPIVSEFLAERDVLIDV